MLISKDVKELGKDICEGNWKLSECTIFKSNTEIWIANGWIFIDFYPSIYAFNFFEKIYLHRCINKGAIKNALK